MMSAEDSDPPPVDESAARAKFFGWQDEGRWHRAQMKWQETLGARQSTDALSNGGSDDEAE
jgi:hypothetical protein